MTGTPQWPQRITRLTPLADLLAAIGREVAPVAVQRVATARAPGLILASDLAFAANRPPRALALRDGYAVRAEWSLDASSYAPVPLPAAPPHVDAGNALPDGFDTVAPLDAIETDALGARMSLTLAPGDGVLAAGADGKAGQHLLPAGVKLSAGRCAALLVVGIAEVPVRRPRIKLVAAKAGASAPIAGALAALAGDIGREGGEAMAGAGSLDEVFAAPAADAIVAVGGTGSGSDDNAVSALARTGTVTAHGIGISPGETTAFGRVQSSPVLLLPGRLDSALAAWMTIGRPLLAQLAGSTQIENAMMATLTRKVTSTIGLAEIVPVRCRDGKAEPLASGYWPLHALAQADGWILVAAESEGYPAGTPVAVRALP